jgi:hypothetical protein
MSVKKLIKGKLYRVIKDGCSLCRVIPTSNCSWRYENLSLFVGNVIEYVGTRRGPGHDNVIFNIFRSEDKEGEFEPNTWGLANMECLEEVEDGD